VRNLLPACKNLGTTHITNGCFRLHPVEWNIGESAGALAAFCLRHKLEPKQVREDSQRLLEFQSLLIDQGVELEWPVTYAFSDEYELRVVQLEVFVAHVGLVIAPVTPMDRNGAVRFELVPRQADLLLSRGAKGFICVVEPAKECC